MLRCYFATWNIVLLNSVRTWMFMKIRCFFTVYDITLDQWITWAKFWTISVCGGSGWEVVCFLVTKVFSLAPDLKLPAAILRECRIFTDYDQEMWTFHSLGCNRWNTFTVLPIPTECCIPFIIPLFNLFVLPKLSKGMQYKIDEKWHQYSILKFEVQQQSDWSPEHPLRELPLNSTILASISMKLGRKLEDRQNYKTWNWKGLKAMAFIKTVSFIMKYTWQVWNNFSNINWKLSIQESWKYL